MLNCSVKGCKESISELISGPLELKRWFVATPEEWPNLDWYALGGVDKIVLCPLHRGEVFMEVISQRINDISMNPTDPTPGNRH